MKSLLSILPIFALTIVLSGCVKDISDNGGEKISQPAEVVMDDNSSVVMNPESDDVNSASSDYMDLTPFIKSNLTSEEVEKLSVVLNDRTKAQAEIKEKLTLAKENGTLDKAFEEVETRRETCIDRLMPYIDESSVEDFKEHCATLGDNLKAKFAN